MGPPIGGYHSSGDSGLDRQEHFAKYSKLGKLRILKGLNLDLAEQISLQLILSEVLRLGASCRPL